MTINGVTKIRQATFGAILFGLVDTIDAWAVEISHRAVAVELNYGYAISSRENLETGLELGLEAEFELATQAELITSGRLRFDGERRLDDPRNRFDTYSKMTRPARIGQYGVAELRDFYLRIDSENIQWRLGKQQIVWGALDGLKVTDVLNPQDFREFILDDFADSRIGLWSAYADASVGAFRLELAWLPDPTAHDIASPDAWFGLSAPRFRLGQPVGAQATLSDDSFIGEPDDKLGRGGLRLSRTLGNASISLLALSTLDFEPTIEPQLNAGSVMFKREYHDLRLYGATAETAVGSFVIRAEIAYRPNRYFNVVQPGLNSIGIDKRDQWTAAVGMDVDGPWGLFANLQLLYDRVDEGSTASGGELVRPRTDKLVTLLVRKQFLHDTLTVDARWYTELEIDDGLIRMALTYALGDNTSIVLSGDAFYGSANGFFGQFSKRDRASISLKHTF